MKLLPSWIHLPPCFQTVCINTIASVVYHLQYLKDNLPITHPFHTCITYRSKQLDLWFRTPNLVIAGAFECKVTNMVYWFASPHSTDKET
jgi:hypothetical protein